MSDRDPRTNPQKGDVIKKGRCRRTRYREVTEWHGWWGFYKTSEHSSPKDICLDQWQAWARDAEVVTGEG